MGPSHPSTHGVLRIVLEMDGEVVVRADPDIGYLHRGMEKIAETYGFTKFIPYTDRMDYLAPVANNIAVCTAAEVLMGLEIPERAKAIRVVCAELGRISSHLLGLGAFAMDIGALTVFLYTFREREAIYNHMEHLTGARFTVSYPRVGGLSRDLPEGWREAVLGFARELPGRIERDVEKLLTRNRIWMGRLEGVAVIPREVAVSYGLTGPNLRGSGVKWDLRKEMPYFGYENYDFDVPVGSRGDAYDRYLCRVEEIKQSARIITQALERLPGGPVAVEDGKHFLPPKAGVMTRMEELIHQFMIVTEGPKAPVGEIYWAHENPKGELGFYIVGDGTSRPYRLRMRAPSFVNLSILPWLLPGNMLSDVVATLASLDFVMGECDR
ncbi:MAG: NADH-quinone oxidoreductase subunit D [Planctomycetaceae bacterium]|nr:NADH dehydrogenase (quinone) subunit D [Planctomycetota bacterium]NUN52288.1 NADH-quinone oxidoreductase subunit D [Planctomycetaceae bacterium]